MARFGVVHAAVSFALLLPLVGAAEPAAYAPLAALAATVEGGAVVVSWVPGTEPADAYRVYGILGDGARVLLAPNVTGYETSVPGGYTGYAVSGVKLTVESDPIPAVYETCVVISIQPPDVRIWCPTDKAQVFINTP